MENYIDKKLIADYLNGDDESLEVLIQWYLKLIYGFVYRYVGNADEAEDITQEVFVRIWRNLKNFDSQKNFKTWIFSIAKNAVIDFLRKKKTMPFSAFDIENGNNLIFDNFADSDLLPNEISRNKETERLLAGATKKLPSNYRKVFFLHYDKNLNFREIAEMLGEPLNTIKSCYRRAVHSLREILSNSF